MSFNPNLFELPPEERRRMAMLFNEIISRSPNIVEITPYVVERMKDYKLRYRNPAQIIPFDSGRKRGAA